MTYLLYTSAALFIFGAISNERGVRRNRGTNLDGCLFMVAGVIGCVLWWAWRISQ